MTTWKDIIAINDTTSDIFLEDLGLTIPASSQVLLHEQFEFSEIANADPIKNEVVAGNIIINDGISNLSILNALEYITYWGKYEYRQEQAFIELFQETDQFLDYVNVYKILNLDSYDIEPKNLRLDGTTEIVIELAGIYIANYQVNFHYFGNATTIQYSVIAEKNGVEFPRSKTVGWSRYSDSRLTLTNGVRIMGAEVNDTFILKAKASRNVQNITIEQASVALIRIYD